MCGSARIQMCVLCMFCVLGVYTRALYTLLWIISQHFSDEEKCVCFGKINFFFQIYLSFVSRVELWKAVFGLLQSLAGHWRQQIAAALSRLSALQLSLGPSAKAITPWTVTRSLTQPLTRAVTTVKTRGRVCQWGSGTN